MIDRPLPFRVHLVAVLLAGLSGALLAAYLLAVTLRLDLSRERLPALMGLLCWTLLVTVVPRHASYSAFLALPLFGNHPGGALMELLNLMLAATTFGLVLRAWRGRRVPPGGSLWTAAVLVLLSAALALLRSLPEAIVRAAQIDSVPSFVTQALTAAETVPLYSVASFVGLLVVVTWAYALSWAGPDLDFARNALRYLALGLFASMAVGILGFHGRIDIPAGLLSRIDPNGAFLEGFQSLFWNPGWFALYFTMAFALVLGLLWLEHGRLRAGVALGLVVSYGYFLANRQRGGFLALHAVLLAALVVAPLPQWSRRARLLAVALLAGTALAATAAVVEGSRWFLALQRLLGSTGDIHRWTLWKVALQMWRSSPLFGVGEGAFGWRYRDFLSEESARDIGVFIGDAHNTWLQLLATRGVLGLATFLVLLVTLGRAAVVAARSRGPERGVGLGLVFALVAFVVYANVQWMFYLQSVQALFFMMVVLASAVAPRDGAGTPISRSLRSMLGIAAVAVVALQVVGSRPHYVRAAADVARQPRGFYGPARWPRGGELFRWSSKKGTLWLYPSGPVMTLQVLTTDPRAAARPVTVTFSVEGRLLDRFDLRRGSTLRSVFLPESYRYRPPPSPPAFGELLPGRAALPLTVEVSRLWTPSLMGSLDGRFFGVAVFAPTFRAAHSDEELGVIRSLDGTEPGVRWAGPRYSASVDVPSPSSGLAVPLRPGVWDGTPVSVEAFWDERRVGSYVLGDDRWREVRIALPTSASHGVLTLQADRAWPTAMTSAVDRPYAALRIGPWR